MESMNASAALEALKAMETQDWIDVAAQWLRQINPSVKDGALEDSHSMATWYLTPRHHVQLFLAMNVICLLLLIPVWRSLRKNPPSHTPRLDPTVFEFVLLFLLTLSFTTVVYYKLTMPWRLPFLSQPCHVWSFMLLIVYLTQTESAAMVLRIAQFGLFMPVGAMLFPDTTDYVDGWEITCYWIQHFAIVTLPVVAIARRPALLKYDWRLHAMFMITYVFYHHNFLVPFGVYTGTNLNLMLSPPRIAFIMYWERHYHIFAQCASLVFSICSYALIWLASFVLPQIQSSSSSRRRKKKNS